MSVLAANPNEPGIGGGKIELEYVCHIAELSLFL
jgi:hypothetical protein